MFRWGKYLIRLLLPQSVPAPRSGGWSVLPTDDTGHGFFGSPAMRIFTLWRICVAAWGDGTAKARPHPDPGRVPHGSRQARPPFPAGGRPRPRCASSHWLMGPRGCGYTPALDWRARLSLQAGAGPGEAGPRGGAAAAVALGRRRVMAVAMDSAVLLLLALLGPAAALAGYIEVCGGRGGQRAGIPGGIRCAGGRWAHSVCLGWCGATWRLSSLSQTFRWVRVFGKAVSLRLVVWAGARLAGMLGAVFGDVTSAFLARGPEPPAQTGQRLGRQRAIRGLFPREKPRLNESTRLLMDPKKIWYLGFRRRCFSQV